jgi:8-oxo-dGTP diphosphatase
LEEETGLKGVVKRLIGVDNEDSSIYGNVLVIGYEVEVKGGILRAGSDTLEVRFFPVDGMPPLPFESHKRVIEKGVKITEKTHTTKDYATVNSRLNFDKNPHHP